MDALPDLRREREVAERRPEAFDIERFQRGDRRYLEEIIRLHKGDVKAAVRGFSNDEDEQEDLFQKVWIQVLRHGGSFRGECGFSTWLHKVAVNVCRMHVREKRSRAASLEIMGESGRARELSWSCPDPAEEAMSEEERMWLADALERLPAQRGRAVALRYLEGQAYDKIARLLGVKESTARSHVRHGLAHLRRFKGKEDKE